MRVQRNQDDQRWKYRTYHLRRLCRHHLKNLSFSSYRRFRGIIEISSYQLDRSKFSETYRFLSFGVWVCRGDCRILGGRKVFRVSCGHQRGHQFLNFRLLFGFGNWPTWDFRFNLGYLFHDSVPSFPEWKTELKIMKIMCPSKLTHQKK